MSTVEEPAWPTVDPDATPIPSAPTAMSAPSVRSGLRRPRLWLALGLVFLLAALAGLAVGSDHTVGGLAFPAAGQMSTSRPTSREPTSTVAPIAPLYRLEDHPLLAAGVTVADLTCPLPAFRRDAAGLQAYYEALIGCLNQAWHPVLLAGGMPHSAPAVNVAENPGETGCDDPGAQPADTTEFTAFYCPADETLYLPLNRLKDVDRGVATSHLAVLAHEYSHHVQALSGLLGAAGRRIDDAGADTATVNELTRRIELQANCFAGLFLAAAAGRGGISRRLADAAVADFRNGGLPDTHGSRNHQAAWAKKGYQQRTTAACNTWTAPLAEIG